MALRELFSGIFISPIDRNDSPLLQASYNYELEFLLHSKIFGSLYNKYLQLQIEPDLKDPKIDPFPIFHNSFLLFYNTRNKVF